MSALRFIEVSQCFLQIMNGHEKIKPSRHFGKAHGIGKAPHNVAILGKTEVARRNDERLAILGAADLSSQFRGCPSRSCCSTGLAILGAADLSSQCCFIET